MISIRSFLESDWSSVWAILQPVFKAAETYAFDPDMTEQEGYSTWIDLPKATFVAIDESQSIVGTYYIKTNFQGPGSHVCNCGYVVSNQTRGRGIASAMCLHSQEQAPKFGYHSMQFNSVVSTNEDAIHLWKKLGFQVIGTLPGVFNHPRYGFVDALVMFKDLVK